MNMNLLKLLLLSLICFNACTAKLCMFVDSGCAAGGSTTTNGVCHSTTNFVMTDSSVYGMKYQGVIKSIKTGNGDKLKLYANSDCTSLVVRIDISGYTSCQNNNIFMNKINYSSYKLC